MNKDPFPISKRFLIIATALTLAFAGYWISKVPFGGPSADVKARQMLDNITSSSLQFTLDEFERYFVGNNAQISWEQVDEEQYIMRILRPDPLTRRTNEIAIALNLIDSRQQLSQDSYADIKAIAVGALALNDRIMEPASVQAALYQFQVEIFTRKQRGRL